ncbi:MAG: LysR family transcriptional regulator [Gammaproteobacteria bacterium]
MDKLSAIRSFAAVIHTGSFSEAANQLNLTQASVSKKVAALEEALDCQLLIRNSRRLTLTSAGEAYYVQGTELLANLDDLEDQLREESSTPRGVVKLTAPIPFASRVLIPLLPRFYREYPEIKIELVLSDDQQNLISGKFDIAIRASQAFDDSSLIARHFFNNPLWLIASPEYLARNGTPVTPQDMEQHNFISYSQFSQVSKLGLRKGRRKVEIDVSGNLSCNNGDAILASALEGIGIGELPEWMIDSHIADGNLVRVLPDFTASDVPFKLIYPRRDHMPMRLKVLIDFLKANVRL